MDSNCEHFIMCWQIYCNQWRCELSNWNTNGKKPTSWNLNKVRLVVNNLDKRKSLILCTYTIIYSISEIVYNIRLSELWFCQWCVNNNRDFNIIDCSDGNMG